MEIILARHAETEGNANGIFQGQTYDFGLNQLGQKQAQALAKALAKTKIDAVYTSPLQRNLETAAAITQQLLLEPAITDDRLMEINHGDWSGKTKQEIQNIYPEQLAAWRHDPATVTMPNGEHINDVYERALDFIREIAQKPYNRVLIITHDAVIRALLTRLLMRELSDLWLYQLDAAGYSTIEWNGSSAPNGKFKHGALSAHVVKINENSHLNGLASDLSRHAL